MNRRDFMQLAGMSAGAMVLPLPSFGQRITQEELLLRGMDVTQKKKLSDIALNTAKANGATYADVRIGRYLNQFVVTRENKVQNVINTESFGTGVRVIVNGTWGFSSTDNVTQEGIIAATKEAVAIAKANSKFQKEPLKLAPVKSYGEVTWKTPITKN